MNDYYIVVFNNTIGAIEGEKVLKAEGLSVTIMPTPSIITQSCGISIKFDEEDLDKIRLLIEKDALHIKHVYRKNHGDFEVVI